MAWDVAVQSAFSRSEPEESDRQRHKDVQNSHVNQASIVVGWSGCAGPEDARSQIISVTR